MQGSGLRSMRLSNDGQNWTAWETYAAERPWTIPAISRQSWPIYLQVQDGVGLESGVISHTLYFDVNASQPRSTNFRLFDYLMSAGHGLHSSNVYSGSSTIGQVVDSAWLTSHQFSAQRRLSSRVTGYSDRCSRPRCLHVHQRHLRFRQWRDQYDLDCLLDAGHGWRARTAKQGPPSYRAQVIDISRGSSPPCRSMRETPPRRRHGPTPTPEPTPANVNSRESASTTRALFTNSPM